MTTEDKILEGSAPAPNSPDLISDGDTFDMASGEYLGNLSPITKDLASFPVNIEILIGGYMFEYKIVDKTPYEQTRQPKMEGA